MLRPYLFFFLLFIGTGSVVVSIERLLTVDPFLNVSDPFLINNDGLSGPILGQIKKFHGLSADPYDVGIFGSSTSMMVTAQNLDVGTELNVGSATSQFTVVSSGSSIMVGIGTTNPLHTLDVRGDTNIEGNLTVNNNTIPSLAMVIALGGL